MSLFSTFEAKSAQRLKPGSFHRLTRRSSALVSRKRPNRKTRDRAEARFSCFARLPRADALG